MTKDEAIEGLSQVIEGGSETHIGDKGIEAIKLGLEALKRIDDQRNGKVLPYERWLPGETEE